MSDHVFELKGLHCTLKIFKCAKYNQLNKISTRNKSKNNKATNLVFTINNFSDQGQSLAKIEFCMQYLYNIFYINFFCKKKVLLKYQILIRTDDFVRFS